MTPGAPAWACRCPSCLGRDAVLLLEDGRAGMALTVLRGLPESVEAAVAGAYAQGLEHGRRAAPKRKPAAKRSARPAKVVAPRRSPAPAFAKVATELAAHIEALGADRVAETLGVALDDLARMLEGRVAPPGAGLRRLRETSE